MKNLRPFLLLLSAFLTSLYPHFALAQTDSSLDAVAGAAYGVIGAALARSEAATALSLVNYKEVKGAFGEAVMERVALGSPRAGGWQKITLSPKKQGIDGLYLRHDSAGRPRSLLVGEAKFDSAKLAMTKNGQQLSPNWAAPRLNQEASRYISAGSASSVKHAPRPRALTANPDVVQVRLSDGRASCFWRNNRLDTWSYDGPQGTLADAQKAALRDGKYVQGAAEGRITYRSREFRIDVEKNTISVKMRDASASLPDRVALREIARVKVDANNFSKYKALIEEDIARQLLAKKPHLSTDDAKTLASSVTRGKGNLEAAVRPKYSPWAVRALDVGKAGMAGGALAGALDLGSQLHTKGHVDWLEFGQVTGAGAGAAVAGSLIHQGVVASAVNNAAMNQFFTATARTIGLPTGMAAANIAGMSLGGAAASSAYALAMWLSGCMSDTEAMRCAAAGTASSLAGMAAGAGVVGFATVYGTAGTGAAISSLSGAAANSAALAWLGGGAASAGGGGAFLGAAVVGGVVVAAAVVAGGVIYLGYALYDDAKTNNRHQFTADHLLASDACLKEICRRYYMPQFSAD